MKTCIYAIAMFLASFSYKAFAGDGFAQTSTGITSILTSPDVQKAASYFFIDSIKQYGEIQQNKMTYILQLQRDDLNESRFCLVVTIDGVDQLRVTEIERWSYGSRLCHMQ